MSEATQALEAAPGLSWDLSLRGRLHRALRRHGAGALGAALVGAAVLVAILAPVLPLHDPTLQQVASRLRPPAWAPGGSWEYPLGTDQLGRDILSRICYGARASLLAGLLTVLISVPLGVGLGMLSAYYGRALDNLIMRLAEGQLAIPTLVLAIAAVGVLGPSLRNLVLVLGLANWMTFARVARGEVLSLREREFVAASRALGARDRRILLRHILPNILTPVGVLATFAVGQMIILESSLSFFGLGVQPPTPSWGGMLADGKLYMAIAWWLSVLPGLAISLTILGVNLMGDWFRELLDPTLQV